MVEEDAEDEEGWIDRKEWDSSRQVKAARKKRAKKASPSHCLYAITRGHGGSISTGLYTDS